MFRFNTTTWKIMWMILWMISFTGIPQTSPADLRNVTIQRYQYFIAQMKNKESPPKVLETTGGGFIVEEYVKHQEPSIPSGDDVLDVQRHPASSNRSSEWNNSTSDSRTPLGSLSRFYEPYPYNLKQLDKLSFALHQRKSQGHQRFRKEEEDFPNYKSLIRKFLGPETMPLQNRINLGKWKSKFKKTVTATVTSTVSVTTQIAPLVERTVLFTVQEPVIIQEPILIERVEAPIHNHNDLAVSLMSHALNGPRHLHQILRHHYEVETDHNVGFRVMEALENWNDLEASF